MRVFKGTLSLMVILFSMVIWQERSIATTYPTSSIGEVIRYEKRQVGDLLYEYQDIQKDNGMPAKIFHASFDPQASDLEMVLSDAYSDNQFSQTLNVLEQAKRYEQRTGRKVIAAVNGDFFRVDSGHDGVIKPVGGYIRDGKIYKFSVFGSQTYTNRIGFGFNNQGETLVSPLKDQVNETWSVELNLTNGDMTKTIIADKVNEAPQQGELSLYLAQGQEWVMDTPGTAKYLIKVNLDKNNQPDWGLFRPVNGSAYRLIKGEKVTNKEVVVKQGYIGIEINDKPQELDWFFEYFSICNTLVSLYKVPINQFKDLDYYIGACAYLVQDGNTTTQSCSSGAHVTDAHPRTTIGITKDNKFFVTVLDGRQASWSQGFPTTEQALVAHDFNAYQAVELDGGGSTTFVLRVEDELKVMNHPSDGGLRAVSNVVLIVEKEVSLHHENPLTTNLNSVVPCYQEDKQINTLPLPVEDEVNIHFIWLALAGIGVVLYLKKQK
jgi:exopolysaccharide biosynthesis protein